jgi:hypothetical protein
MKVFLVIMVIISTGYCVEKADTRFSIVANFGYGMALGGYYIGASEKWQPTGLPFPRENTVEAIDKYLNYGRGLQMELGAQIGLMKNLDLLVAFDYTPGLRDLKVEGRILDSMNHTDTFRKHLFGFKTLLLPKFKAFDLIDVYVGGGIGLFWTSLSITSDKSNIKGYFKTKPALSFSGKIGMVYPVNDRFGINFDITYDAMSFTVKITKEPGEIGENILTEDSPNSGNAPFKITGSNVGLRAGVIIGIF